MKNQLLFAALGLMLSTSLHAQKKQRKVDVIRVQNLSANAAKIRVIEEGPNGDLLDEITVQKNGVASTAGRLLVEEGTFLEVIVGEAAPKANRRITFNDLKNQFGLRPEILITSNNTINFL